MDGTDQRIVDALMPAVESLTPADSVRMARRVNRALDGKGNVIRPPAYGSAWNSNTPLLLGAYHLWIDASGNLRKKNGKAANDTDGVIV